MSFPLLLRKSAFASFDPAVTRVYQSTPHSVNVYGDFGLKYPVHRRKGPKYIKVHNLDEGRFLGSDWRSAEKEARFVEAYGDGRTPWRHGEEDKFRALTPKTELFGDVKPDKVELMDDVNAMRPKDFEKYLDDVRKYRKSFLQRSIKNMGPAARESLSLPEDYTFVNIAARGHIAKADTSKYQVALAKQSIDMPESKRLHSVPHRLYGLSYSRLPPNASEHNPILFHPGRAIEPSTSGRSNVSGTNRPYVVSMGGVTGNSYVGGGRISEGASIEEGIDFSRENPDQGSAIFRVALAKVRSPPTVVNSSQKRELMQTNSRATRSADRTPPAFDTFKFEIAMEHVPQDAVRARQTIGTKEWVARDQRVGALRLQDWMGAGGPKSGRSPGEALKNLQAAEETRRQEARMQGSDQIAKILAKLAKKSSEQ